MSKKIQIGAIGYRNEQGEIYKIEPIFKESTPELEKGYELLLQKFVKFFIDYFALKDENADNPAG